ncbi:hypothetical protein [Sulfitobacter mediterraneus]|uniref:hypothetical protein n=1 Tax=Sulfitobacter mediterraneus TaxID=83219 RepID=UPI0013C46D81|nr:hypothetical protein [Sulfitobacter mediterraneus]UWR13329.1 hypothetical protein K3753_02085 [Sulfitobacter mediterraneus]
MGDHLLDLLLQGAVGFRVQKECFDRKSHLNPLNWHYVGPDLVLRLREIEPLVAQNLPIINSHVLQIETFGIEKRKNGREAEISLPLFDLLKFEYCECENPRINRGFLTFRTGPF